MRIRGTPGASGDGGWTRVAAVSTVNALVGSIGVGYWIAHGAFWLLIVFAATERGRRAVALFLALWVAGYLLLRTLPQGTPLFVSYVALLDVGLVFAVFRGDVRLT